MQQMGWGLSLLNVPNGEFLMGMQKDIGERRPGVVGIEDLDKTGVLGRPQLLDPLFRFRVDSTEVLPYLLTLVLGL